MPDQLTGPAEQILAEPNSIVLSVPRKDGTIQSVVIWAHAQDGEVTVNSAEGRAWPDNLRRAKTATVTAMRGGEDNEYVTVTCTLTEEVGEPEAGDHINMLMKKYTGEDEFPRQDESERRVMFRLRPERVFYADMRAG